MPSGELASKTIHELRALLAKGSVSPQEIVDDVLSRIERLNPSLHAYLAVDADRLPRNAAPEYDVRVPRPVHQCCCAAHT